MRYQYFAGFLHSIPCAGRFGVFSCRPSFVTALKAKPSFIMSSSHGSVPSSAVNAQNLQSVSGLNANSAPEGPLGLSRLTFEDTFVNELPADPEVRNFVRQVRDAAYSFVGPTDASKDDQRELWRSVGQMRESSNDPPPLKKDLIAWSTGAAKLLDLDPTVYPSEDEKSNIVDVLGGFEKLWPGMRCYAACYAGHQFGSFAGILGDGRAITLGEYVNKSGERWEVQIKGAGKTPYSRHADGRAVLRSSVREFLASEAMFHLGIPTTRALALVSTGAGVIRDMFYMGDPKLENGAVLTRMAPTLLRIGSFEAPAANGNHDLLKQLADYAIKYHFPQLMSLSDDVISETRNRYGGLVAEVVRLNAETVALWQGVGFVHGVLNTDNTSILGLTIDYGPYGFLDGFRKSYTPNTTDIPGGRYCYELQPKIIKWNLFKFASAMVPLCGLADAQRAAESFDAHYDQAHRRLFAKKLGLSELSDDDDDNLLHELLDLMDAASVDFTNTWRSLSGVVSSSKPEHLDRIFSSLIAGKAEADTEKWKAWMARYHSRVVADSLSDAERVESMNSVNPVYILRNYMAQEAIDAANKGNFGLIEHLYQLLRTPYDERSDAARYTQDPPSWASRPGVCVNSCSS